MKQLLSSFLLLVICSSYSFAQSDVYLCVDANGKKKYTNTGSTKGCKLMELQPINGISSPPSAKKATSSKSTAAAPANFPKVDSGTQKNRDSDRKVIFQEELKAEEQKLANLKKEYNNGEPVRRADEGMAHKYVERVNTLKADIERTEKNIAALTREISNLK